jgi:hypothetical protein
MSVAARNFNEIEQKPLKRVFFNNFGSYNIAISPVNNVNANTIIFTDKGFIAFKKEETQNQVDFKTALSPVSNSKSLNVRNWIIGSPSSWKITDDEDPKNANTELVKLSTKETSKLNFSFQLRYFNPMSNFWCFLWICAKKRIQIPKEIKVCVLEFLNNLEPTYFFLKEARSPRQLDSKRTTNNLSVSRQLEIWEDANQTPVFVRMEPEKPLGLYNQAQVKFGEQGRISFKVIAQNTKNEIDKQLIFRGSDLYFWILNLVCSFSNVSICGMTDELEDNMELDMNIEMIRRKNLKEKATSEEIKKRIMQSPASMDNFPLLVLELREALFPSYLNLHKDRFILLFKFSGIPPYFRIGTKPDNAIILHDSSGSVSNKHGIFFFSTSLQNWVYMAFENESWLKLDSSRFLQIKSHFCSELLIQKERFQIQAIPL